MPRSKWAILVIAGALALAGTGALAAKFALGDDGPDWLAQHGLQGRFLAEKEAVLAGGWPETSEPACIS